MFTVILALIQARTKTKYEFAYFGTWILDYNIIQMINTYINTVGGNK